MQIHIKDILHKLVVEYSLIYIAESSGYVYVETRKGMNGLKGAEIITYKRLVHNLQPHRYAPVEHPPGIWTHSTLSTTFTLAVYDFGIKLFATNNSTHLLDSLQKN